MVNALALFTFLFHGKQLPFIVYGVEYWGKIPIPCPHFRSSTSIISSQAPSPLVHYNGYKDLSSPRHIVLTSTKFKLEYVPTVYEPFTPSNDG